MFLFEFTLEFVALCEFAFLFVEFAEFAFVSSTPLTCGFKFASGLKVFEFVLKFIILNPFFSINLKRYIGILGVAFRKFALNLMRKLNLSALNSPKDKESSANLQAYSA